MDLKLDQINHVNFNIYNDIVTQTEYDTRNEFFGPCGQQHYRLLSHLSTLFDNQIIIDIGTHRGSSALALSYNDNNVVLSFDIVNKVDNDYIKQKHNIKLMIDNVFENYETYQNLLLSSPLIVLDIDPHDGFIEYDFYEWLKEHDYQGLLLCDDIWHFEKMRNNFL